MSVVDRLRTLDLPSHEVDVDEALGRVRGRARRRQRGRIVMASLVVVALAGTGFAATVLDADDAQLDTAGPRGPIVRYLPTEVPAGFTLAWVDPESPVETGAEDPVPWHDSLDYDYAFGYRSDGLELEALVYAGVGFDPRHVVISWGEQSQVLAGDQGRPMVVDDASNPSRAIVERPHGTILVLAHPIGEETAAGEGVSDGDQLLTFARSMERRTPEQWDVAIESADVASPGATFESITLLEGETWTLLGSDSRPPRSVTTPTFTLAREHRDYSIAPAGPMTLGDMDGEVTVEMDRAGDVTVAWGAAPADAVAVRLVFAGATIDADTVPYGGATVFAVEVGDVDGDPRSIQALDASGAVLAGVVDHTKGGTCVEVGVPTVDIPDVIGMPLFAAIRAIQDAGLEVIGTGTPPEDPIDPGATISAQEPAAGTRLPEGACVGFRTTSR